MLDLDEYAEAKLVGELIHRRRYQIVGLCDYCHRLPTEPSCRFPERHQRPRSPDGDREWSNTSYRIPADMDDYIVATSVLESLLLELGIGPLEATHGATAARARLAKHDILCVRLKEAWPQRALVWHEHNGPLSVQLRKPASIASSDKIWGAGNYSFCYHPDAPGNKWVLHSNEYHACHCCPTT